MQCFFFSIFLCCNFYVKMSFTKNWFLKFLFFENFNTSKNNLIIVEATKVLQYTLFRKNLTMNHGRTSHSLMHHLFIFVYPRYINLLLTFVHNLKFKVQAIVFKTMVQIKKYSIIKKLLMSLPCS